MQEKDLKTSLMLPRIYPDEDSLWVEDHEEIRSLNADIDPEKYTVKFIDERLVLEEYMLFHLILFEQMDWCS